MYNFFATYQRRATFGSREINSLVNFLSGISVKWFLKTPGPALFVEERLMEKRRFFSSFFKGSFFPSTCLSKLTKVQLQKHPLKI